LSFACFFLAFHLELQLDGIESSATTFIAAWRDEDKKEEKKAHGRDECCTALFSSIASFDLRTSRCDNDDDDDLFLSSLKKKKNSDHAARRRPRR